MTPEQKLVSAAKEIAQRFRGQLVSVVVRLEGNGPAEVLFDPARIQSPAREPDLAKAILTVLHDSPSPLKGMAIAIRAGVSFNGYFRQVIGRMVREGRVWRTCDGYAAESVACFPAQENCN